MAYEFSSDLWPAQKHGVERTINAITADKDVVLFGPTGSGKTRQAIELFKWADANGMTGVFYINRKLLIPQCAERFADAGLDYGVRAAEYDDHFRPDSRFQIASAQSEWSRSYKNMISSGWSPHKADLVIVDEAHIQKGKTMKKMLADHKEQGAKVVMLTATPVGLHEWADELVVSGTMSQFRDCKAIVPAVVKSFLMPDMRKVKRNCTGEYMIDGKVRREYTQTIVGDVFERWKVDNPDARPAMAYWPGKDESVWGTQRFTDMGVSWCHVDATDAVIPERVVIDGVATIRPKTVKLNRKIWQEILERYKAGDIVGLSSRFKLREGIDVPMTWHCILACPIGSLASYLQTVGRVLRYSKQTPDSVLVSDFGGNYWRHGSPNADRPWDEWWKLSEKQASEAHRKNVESGKAPESICCPRCKSEFLRFGPNRTCPLCGHEFPPGAKGKREVLMESGKIEVVEGDLIKVRPPVAPKSTPQKRWDAVYWGTRNRIKNGKASDDTKFTQLAAIYAKKFGPLTEFNLDFMPRHREDWDSPIMSVPFYALHGTKRSEDK